MIDLNARIQFIDRDLCDHDGFDKDNDMCYLCGMSRHKVKEAIKEIAHRNELRRIKELKEARGN